MYKISEFKDSDHTSFNALSELTAQDKPREAVGTWGEDINRVNDTPGMIDADEVREIVAQIGNGVVTVQPYTGQALGVDSRYVVSVTGQKLPQALVEFLIRKEVLVPFQDRQHYVVREFLVAQPGLITHFLNGKLPKEFLQEMKESPDRPLSMVPSRAAMPSDETIKASRDRIGL